MKFCSFFLLFLYSDFCQACWKEVEGSVNIISLRVYCLISDRFDQNFSVFLNISEEAVKSVRYHRHGSMEFKPMMVPVGKVLPLFSVPIPNLYTCFLLCSDYIWMQSESEVVGGRDCWNPALNQLKLLWNPGSKGRSVVAAGSIVKQGEHWIFWLPLSFFWYGNEFLLLYIGIPLNRHIFIMVLSQKIL